MEAVDQRLVRREHGLVQLLDPPFDKSNLNPGYIKGYVPGVRENGGQYTHAAIWAAMAFAALGDSRRAWELLSMINPISHATSPEAIEAYKVEPYVVAADIYALSPHTGRGGWTWYTGSAGVTAQRFSRGIPLTRSLPIELPFLTWIMKLEPSAATGRSSLGATARFGVRLP